jgi:hypothetical protein
MDAQDASELHFGPSTRPWKANEKIYFITKDGPDRAQPGHGHAPGMSAPPEPPF